MAPATRRSHVDVVMAALTAASLKPYRGIGPLDPLTTAPYCVVYGGTATTDGPMATLHADLSAEVQVTVVGTTSAQTELWADKVFAALVDTPLTPPTGRAWLRPGSPVDHVLTRPVTRDDDFGKATPVFYTVSVFELASTPA